MVTGSKLETKKSIKGKGNFSVVLFCSPILCHGFDCQDPCKEKSVKHEGETIKGARIWDQEAYEV